MTDYKIYLAGSIRGEKWQVSDYVERLHDRIYNLYPPKYRNNFQFIASDANDDHRIYEGTAPGFGTDTESVRERVTDEIMDCDWLVAYLDAPGSYGSVAEIAFASALGKPCLVFIIVPKENYAALETMDYPSETDSEMMRWNWEMIDAYRLVSNFPNVSVMFSSSSTGVGTFVWSYLQCESPIERRLMMGMIYGDMPWAAVPQLWIGDYRVDFAFIKPKIAIEVDGHDYHSSKDQRAYDAKRDRFLQSEGWKVIRFTGSEVYANTEAVVSEIKLIIDKSLSNGNDYEQD